jgi:transposase
MQAPIPKSMAGPGLITDVVIGKYEYHIPLYRQSKILKGLSINIPDNTLGNWVMQSGDGLRILDDAFLVEMNVAHYLQVDETPVKVLKPEKKAYMWIYLSPMPNHKLIRFEFNLSRESQVVEKSLKDFKGRLQSDGYGGYNGMRKKTDVIGLGYMAHSRRKFAELVKIAPPKMRGKSHEALGYFAKLYAIEDEARKKELSFENRKLLRQKESVPILEKFHEWLILSKQKVPPKSGIADAIDYTLRQWPYLTPYTNHGEAEIDSNWVENQIRPFALGRRNWLFVGAEESAQIAALFYSLIQSAKLNGLNPRTYLHYVLTQIHALRKNEIAARDLLPHRIDIAKLHEFGHAEFLKAKSLFTSQAS